MSVLENINLEEVKFKLYERLKPSGWGDKLKTFILSNEFDKILLFLLKDAREGKRFTPTLNQVFRCFEQCPYDSLKVIIVNHNPYFEKSVADGIAFSCSNTDKLENALSFIFQEINDTVYKDGREHDPDLKRWSNQGILLINTAFTTTIGRIDSHYDIWKPFITFLFDILTCQKDGLIYVFIGKKAQEWMDVIPESNSLLTCTHPALSGHISKENWDSGDVFNKINELANKNFNTEIIW